MLFQSASGKRALRDTLGNSTFDASRKVIVKSRYGLTDSGGAPKGTRQSGGGAGVQSGGTMAAVSGRSS